MTRLLLLVALATACGGEAARAPATSANGGAETANGEGATSNGPGSDGPVVSPDPTRTSDPELACTSVSDCVLLTDACGWPAAANAAHAAEVEARYRALACCASCAAPPPGTAHAECVAGSCTAVRDLPAAAGS